MVRQATNRERPHPFYTNPSILCTSTFVTLPSRFRIIPSAVISSICCHIGRMLWINMGFHNKFEQPLSSSSDKNMISFALCGCCLMTTMPATYAYCPCLA